MITRSYFNSLIVTFNSADEIPGLLGDLQRLAPPHHIIVVDNASQDPTAEIVRTRFPEVSLIVNPRNLGYSKAVNQGVELCETEHVFLLNPDMRILNSRFHSAMLDCLQQSPAIAAVGPLQFVQRGAAYRINLTWSYWTPRGFAVYLSHALSYRRTFDDAPIPTTFLNAGCLLLRKSAFIHVGKLNEKYFLYGEEPDLFLKFKRYGYECRLHPGVGVIHFRERSLRKLPLSQRWLRKLQAPFNIGDALIRGLVNLVVARLVSRAIQTRRG
jgi:GT2 family glycosyltransferase